MKRNRLILVISLSLTLGVCGAGFALQQETQKPNEKDSKEAPLTEDQQLEMGKTLYETTCKMCHRTDGKGTLEEMDLTDNVWRHGDKAEDIEKVIREGVKDTGMRPIMGEHSDQEIRALVKYVLKFSEAARGAETRKNLPR